KPIHRKARGEPVVQSRIEFHDPWKRRRRKFSPFLPFLICASHFLDALYSVYSIWGAADEDSSTWKKIRFWLGESRAPPCRGFRPVTFGQLTGRGANQCESACAEAPARKRITAAFATASVGSMTSPLSYSRSASAGRLVNSNTRPSPKC